MSIFEEQISRKPDKYFWADAFIKTTWKSFWSPDEFSFQSDLQDFKTILSDEDKEAVIRSLSLIAQIEVQIKRFWANLGVNLPHPSLNDLGLTLSNTEVIHNLAYQKLIDVLGMEDVFEQNLQIPTVRNRVKYLSKYTHRFYKDSRKQYLYAITLFTIFMENISLFSQFYTISWYNRNKNVLKDTSNQILYTSKEELVHFLVGVKIINTIREEHPELFDNELEEKVISEAVEAFEIESKIIEWILGDVNYQGLNKEVLKEFIKNRINDSMVQIGYRKPFDNIDKELLKETKWFEEEVLGGMLVDFFNQRPVNYTKEHKNLNADDLF